jgi:hypothetical protein
MKNKIIKFPNTPINQLSNAQKLAMEMETNKNQVQEEIEWNMNRNDWDKIPLQESKWFVNILGHLNPGNYIIKKNKAKKQIF